MFQATVSFHSGYTLFGKPLQNEEIPLPRDTYKVSLQFKNVPIQLKRGQRSTKSLTLVRNIDVGFLCLIVIFLTSQSTNNF